MAEEVNSSIENKGVEFVNVLLTGANGFLGRYIKDGFSQNRIPCDTLGRNNATICSDLSKEVPLLLGYDRVVHVAGKAHQVPKTPLEKQAFFDVNVLGTKNLCEAIQRSTVFPKQLVLISSVSVYGLSRGNDILEGQERKGLTPYAQSKMEAENFIVEWGKKHKVKILILRLPLVVGKNAPGNLGAMIDGIGKGRYFSIGGGTARKSMVLASDVAECIVKNENAEGIFHLTDGLHPTFREIEQCISSLYHVSEPISIPLFWAKCLAKIGNVLSFIPFNDETLLKMTCDLTFNDQKARRELGWKPRPVIENLFE